MNLFKGILKKLFNRISMCIIGILLQIFYLMTLFWQLGMSYNFSYLAFEAVAVIMSFYVINRSINPSYKITWVMTIMIFPIFGVMFYIFFGNSNSGSRLRRKMDIYNRYERRILPQNEKTEKKLEDAYSAQKQAEYIYRFGGYPVYDGCETVYFPSGEAKFERLIKELEQAQDFIFLEYFIIGEGKMWNTILDILQKKSDEGVDVRVIYDDIGCLKNLPYKYAAELEKTGIKTRVFNRFRPILSAKMNNRDHRKILVIDGKTAFTGGINLADEYINEDCRFGHWKDTAVMIKGNAVRSFTAMFLTMWSFLNGIIDERYTDFCPVTDENRGEGFVIPFTDSPLDEEPVGENVYLNIINSARKYVYVTTPYLIVDNEVQTALILAAKSGIDVRIITPHVPDKWYVHSVTRGYYPELVKNGVRIYEYTPGFIHAKNFISDDETAVVGTINLDFRSLYLHFECAVWLYKTSCISDIKKDFLETLEVCEEITLEKCRRGNVFKRLGRTFLKFFAPLM